MDDRPESTVGGAVAVSLCPCGLTNLQPLVPYRARTPPRRPPTLVRMLGRNAIITPQCAPAISSHPPAREAPSLISVLSEPSARDLDCNRARRALPTLAAEIGRASCRERV